MADWFKTSDEWWINLDNATVVKKMSDLKVFFPDGVSVILHDPGDRARLRRRLNAAVLRDGTEVLRWLENNNGTET